VNGLWVPEGNHIRHMQSQIASFIADRFSCDLSTAADSLFIFLSAALAEPDFADKPQLRLVSGLACFSHWKLPTIMN
jgi:hypothetical protein